jgi:hypothetical protein
LLSTFQLMTGSSSSSFFPPERHGRWQRKEFSRCPGTVRYIRRWYLQWHLLMLKRR